MRALVGLAAAAAATTIMVGCASGAGTSEVSIVLDGDVHTVGPVGDR